MEGKLREEDIPSSDAEGHEALQGYVIDRRGLLETFSGLGTQLTSRADKKGGCGSVEHLPFSLSHRLLAALSVDWYLSIASFFSLGLDPKGTHLCVDRRVNSR